MDLSFFLNYFERPFYLFLIIPILIILIYFIRKDFIKFYYDDLVIKRRKKVQVFVFISRLLIFIALILALASPYIQIPDKVLGDPKVKIFVDNSTSMDLYDLSKLNSFRDEIGKNIPVENYFLGQGNDSRLAEGILTNIQPNDNILIITDGNNQGSISLNDLVLHANEVNVSISALNLIPNKNDFSVVVHGPEKTTANAENSFKIEVKKTKNESVKLVIDVDGSVVFNKDF